MKLTHLISCFLIAFVPLGAQSSSKTIDPDERAIILLFASHLQGVSPVTELLNVKPSTSKFFGRNLLYRTSDPITGQMYENPIPKQDIQTHAPLIQADIDAAIEAILDRGANQEALDLRLDSELVKCLKISDNTSTWRISRVGFDHSRTWAVVIARYGQMFSGGFTESLFRKENGSWRVVLTSAAHVL